MDFNFRHDHRFQSGISFDRYTNAMFRSGYEDGYTDAYSGFKSKLDPSTTFQSKIDAFRFGYKEGYNHGVMDRETKLGFNMSHDHQLPSGIIYNSFADPQFRASYKEGYTDGYNNQPSSFNQQPTTEAPLIHDSVTVFTDPGYSGSARDLEVGRYPFLEDSFNDAIESIRTKGNVRVILFDQNDFQGHRLIIEQDTPDLGGLNFAGRAASIIVEPIR